MSYICTVTKHKNYTAMKTLQNLIGDSTYLVTDNVSNRFNFFGLIEVDQNLIGIAEKAEAYTEWSLAEELPEDVQRAANVMAENDVTLNEFTGIVTFDDGDATYYLLTW